MEAGNTTEYTVKHRIINEHVIEGRRLGRHLLHDSRSREYPAETATKIVSVVHNYVNLPLDQANVGSCTGEALTGACNSLPLFRAGDTPKTQQDAYHVYHDETVMEGQPWPPNDPGGSGLMVCRAGKNLGWITSYRHAFGIDHALKALVLRPVMFGADWYEGFDNPDRTTGVVKIAGQIRGGHEFLGIGIDVSAREIILINSWGLSYGLSGVFRMSFETMDQLLQSDGDCTVPYRKV